MFLIGLQSLMRKKCHFEVNKMVDTIIPCGIIELRERCEANM